MNGLFLTYESIKIHEILLMKITAWDYTFPQKQIDLQSKAYF